VSDLTEPPPIAVGTEPLENDPGAAFGMQDGAEFGFAKTASLFRSLDYGFLLPFKKVFNQGLLRKKAVRWVLLFGLSPIAIFVATQSFELSFVQTIWLLEGYFCLFWALYFHTLTQPGTAIWRRALGYAAFTALIGIPIDLLVQNFPVIRSLFAAANGESWIGRFFGLIFGVGLIEEAIKALPLLVFGLRGGKIKTTREGLFLGLMSGLGFAASEGVSYSLNSALVSSNVGSESAFTMHAVQMIFRMMSGPILHGAWAGIAGWFIGLAATRTSPRWPVIVVGIAFVALLHGVNDVFAGTLLHLAVAGFSLLILMAYLTHNEVPTESTTPPPAA
jgi:RsiW-degrading membrane proteinase PrsW (M82 family)